MSANDSEDRTSASGAPAEGGGRSTGRPMAELHRLHDGELGAEERAAVEAALDEDDRLRLGALGDLGALLRATREGELAALPALDVWAGIEQRIAAEKVVSLDAERHRRRRRNATWAALSSFAAAAAVLLVLVNPFGNAEASDDTCQIDSVEATDAHVTVFRVAPGRNKSTTTIVWLQEEP